MYRILLVEDDRPLALEMQKQIEKYGNRVYLVEDFHDITAEFSACQPQLVLMDIMLPYKDGYYWTGEIRRMSDVPIMFVSSASDNMNIVMAINMGGDDFVAKPVEPMVLNAKISAILRRTYELTGKTDSIEFCGAVLDLNSGTVRMKQSPDGNELRQMNSGVNSPGDFQQNEGVRTAELTRNEFKLLQTLLENRGKIVSRDALMIRLWNDDIFVEENTLTVNMTRLRKKLEEIGLTEVIQTKSGSGYIIK